MRKKMMLSYMIVILLGTLITGVFAYQVAQQHYTTEVENKLLTIGQIIQQDIISKQNTDADNVLDSIAKYYGETANVRVTIVNKEGKVLGDSSADYIKLENHSDRPEIRKALQTGQGESTRYSTSIKQYLKYVALKIETKHKPIIVRLSIPISDISVIRNQLIMFIIVGVIISILVAGSLGVQFADRITTPIKQLTNITKDIASGNFSDTVKIDANDEIAELSESFMDMKAQLDKTINQLSERNIEMRAILNSMIGGLVAIDNNNCVMLINQTAREMFDIRQKDVINKNILYVLRNHIINAFLNEKKDSFPVDKQTVLDLYYEDKYYKIYCSPIQDKSKGDNAIGTLLIMQDVTNIQKLENIRSEFVSNVTHELKTPLTSIKGFTDTLKSGAIKDEKVAERFLDIIDIEAERLHNLIGDILNLSEIETMKQDIAVQEYFFEDILNEVIAIIRPSADKKKVSISYKIDPSISKIMMNKDRLKQILINLIDNGVKYNKSNGEVNIYCIRQKDMLELHIIDNGIGIPKEHIPRLFERFYRVDKGRSRNQGGTGLGLSIVKHIVQLYNGTIKVKSEVGKGTEFIIKLPIAV